MHAAFCCGVSLFPYPYLPAAEEKPGGGQGQPEQTVGRANLPQKISGHPPVIPDGIIPVYQQPRAQLHRRNEPRPQQAPQQEGKPGCPLLQLPQQDQGNPACEKHTAVASAPPEKLQQHIEPPARQKPQEKSAFMQ